ncbi:MAG: zinc ribbon domain-containing protein [Ktedonobacteraceae bacterium]|nr:zinc ribbon domain-containing protein [Ktedonobacteraceae bacterium]
MPRYEFLCEQCGPFECWRAFAEAGLPARCPQCATVARKVYTVPGLVKTPAPLAQALYRAEKSAYEPEVVRRESAEVSEKQPSQVVHRPHHGRPWQIGH